MGYALRRSIMSYVVHSGWEFDGKGVVSQTRKSVDNDDEVDSRSVQEAMDGCAKSLGLACTCLSLPGNLDVCPGGEMRGGWAQDWFMNHSLKSRTNQAVRK